MPIPSTIFNFLDPKAYPKPFTADRQGRRQAYRDADTLEQNAQQGFAERNTPPPGPVNPALRTPDALALLFGVLAGGANFGEFAQGYMGGKLRKAEQDTQIAQNDYEAQQWRSQVQLQKEMNAAGQKRRDADMAFDDELDREHKEAGPYQQNQALVGAMRAGLTEAYQTRKAEAAAQPAKAPVPVLADPFAKSRLQDGLKNGLVTPEQHDKIAGFVSALGPDQQRGMVRMVLGMADRARRVEAGEALPYSAGETYKNLRSEQGLIHPELTRLGAEIKRMEGEAKKAMAQGLPKKPIDEKMLDRYRTLYERYHGIERIIKTVGDRMRRDQAQTRPRPAGVPGRQG
ncbi:hypothetical protein EON79_16685 [bacterium]|nr:MAG: hypothetical protein EON79_16685 [bacterium]